ncbi:hypothetical protein FA15DRAFT_665000 [Coprinopsis marcescibilis]|uniref:Uncharacterized protein n=1 Tax=Coprinopsis marcescibilis TaxID=230819 RepID=A0A5C3L816_COPMA|nr:hypothetical protein FA15DRAFT_665000 [Coprinopsis marcescibilis]
MASEPDEDAINIEDLQAQIDLSMSFAQSLASSWVKPRKGTNTSSRSKELESEILESAKRPSRLGVGANVSESAQYSSREAARLKGQLVGKKRPRDESERTTTKPGDDDDGEESRATAIKKKTKKDPFALPRKKSKKESPQVVPVNGANSATLSGTLTPSSKSESTQAAKGSTTQSKSVSLPESPKAKPNVQLSPVSASPNEDNLTSNKPGQDNKPLQRTGSSTPTPKDRPKSGYLALLPPVSPNAKLPTGISNIPLLNLSENSESEDDATGQPSTSPKKKRKRKKKKKKYTDGPGINHSVTNAADGQIKS